MVPNPPSLPPSLRGGGLTEHPISSVILRLHSKIGCILTHAMTSNQEHPLPGTRATLTGQTATEATMGAFLSSI